MTLKPSFQFNLEHHLWGIVDLVYPPRCGGCGKYGSRWCEECDRAIEPLPGRICDICGEPIARGRSCLGCRNNPPAFSMLRTYCIYKEPVRSALIRLKYQGEISLGQTLAWHFAEFIDSMELAADIVVPVPLSEERQRERGYNQVEYLAKPVSQLLGTAYSSKSLKRIRHTRSQVGLGVVERRENVRDAFAAVDSLRGKSVLLIDDTTTTGATLDFASRAIIKAGANNVTCFAYAKALKPGLA